MSAVTASLFWTLLCVGFFVFVCADQETITAKSGQNVTLTCRGANKAILFLVWRRPGLEPEFVFWYRDGFDSLVWHPSFKNRVDLQDRQMKDGDVSVILKDVTINDAGTYECEVIQEFGQERTLISTISLHVDPPGHTGGSVGLIVGLSVSAVLLVAAVSGFLIYRKQKQNVEDSQ